MFGNKPSVLYPVPLLFNERRWNSLQNSTFRGFYMLNLTLNIKLRLSHWELWLPCQKLELCAGNRKLWFQTVAFLLCSSEAGGEKGVSNNRSHIQTRFQWSVFFILTAMWWPVHNEEKRFIFFKSNEIVSCFIKHFNRLLCALREYIQHHKCNILSLIRNSFTISNRERLGTVFVLQSIKVKEKSPPVELWTAYSWS